MRWTAMSMAFGIGAVAVASASPSGATSRPAAPEPRGDLVYRPQCFGEIDADANTGLLGTGASGRASSAGGYGAAAPAKPKSNAKSAPSAAAAPPPPAPPPTSARPVEQAEVPRAERSTVAEEARKEVADDESAPRPGGKPTEPAAPHDASADAKRDAAARPALDWGATVWLSNDDSMSLASAQRVIWNAQQGLRSPMGEIRPHELLNYFSFDTKAPAGKDTFGVLAAARQTGDEVTVAIAVKGATPAPLPLDLTLVVDRSGSMHEEGRMDYTRRGLHVMERSLNAGDRLDLVLFDGEVCTPLENFVVGRDDPALLTRVIDQLQPRGSTNMGIGLAEGYAVARRKTDTQGRNRRLMVITDALLNQGNLDAASLTDAAEAYESDGIRVTGVGVGRGFNDAVLDQLTEKGKGAYVYLGSEAVVDRVFGTGFSSLVHTVAHDVHFAIDLPDSLGLERFYGEEASTTKADVQPIHYYAGTTQLFLQDLRLREGRAVPSDPVEFVAEWTDAATGEPMKKSWRTTVGALLESDPRNVDKGLALMAWTDVLAADALGGDTCGAALDTYAARSGRLLDDAEIAFVNGLVAKRCPGFEPKATLASRTSGRVPYKVRVDADIPIAEVALACAGERWTDPISAADTVALFDAPPGSCTLTLSGATEMAAQVEVPSTGGAARCVVRGGRVSCG